MSLISLVFFINLPLISPSTCPVVTIGFLEREYTYTEGDVTAIVVVLSGPISSRIDFEIAGGSFSGSGFFLPEENVDNYIFFLNVPDDDVALEAPEVVEVTLTLTEPVASPQIAVDPDRINVTILDNDCECYIT